MQSKTTYGLYVILPEDLKPEYTHYMAATEFCLVYTDKPPERRAEVTNFKKLKPEIKLWLNQQIKAVQEEYIAEHPDEVHRSRMNVIEAWERELKAEKERIKGNADVEE